MSRQSVQLVCCAVMVGVRTAPAAEPPADRPQTVKVAAVQCSSELGAVDANRAKLSALVQDNRSIGFGRKHGRLNRRSVPWQAQKGLLRCGIVDREVAGRIRRHEPLIAL